MKPRTLLTIHGSPVVWDGEKIRFTEGMTIDADGSPRAYHPDDKPGLDFLGNAGHPGNWWGVACDGRGEPFVQVKVDPAPGFFVSTTAYQRREFERFDTRRYLDSETERFIVIPGPLRSLVKPVLLGARVLAEYRGRSAVAVVGDIGPSNHLGEGSIALAKALGIPSNPRRGGVDDGVLYTIFPGESCPGYELQPA